MNIRLIVCCSLGILVTRHKLAELILADAHKLYQCIIVEIRIRKWLFLVYTGIHLHEEGMILICLDRLQEWIQQYVATQAKRIMDMHPKQTIKETAYELGFPDTANFCRYFKRATGIYPQEYKKRIYPKTQD